MGADTTPLIRRIDFEYDPPLVYVSRCDESRRPFAISTIAISHY